MNIEPKELTEEKVTEAVGAAMSDHFSMRQAGVNALVCHIEWQRQEIERLKGIVGRIPHRGIR